MLSRNTPGKRYSRMLTAALLRMIAVTLLLIPGAWATGSFKTLHKFTGGRDGGISTSTLILDKVGDLYGTTQSGGKYDAGTVFKVTPSGNGRWIESVLYSFKKDGNDGVSPAGGLLFDEEGNLYGTTGVGGTDNVGTVFKLTPNGEGRWRETVLYSFRGDGIDGTYPELGSLVTDSAGNLYGTTGFGGAHGAGTVFEVSRNADGSWTETVLHSFGFADGAYPFASLIFDAKGNLYSTTQQGGAHLNGTVFKLSPDGGSWTETVLHSFDVADGAGPDGGLIFDSAGNLYGTTEGGGNINQCVNHGGGCGVIFQLRPHTNGSWKEKVLRKFTTGTASLPIAGVIFDAAGNLYGTTCYGGTKEWGTVFKLTPATKGPWRETVLHSFKNHPGACPFSGLISDGKVLYGTTFGDSTSTFGSVFEVVP